MSFRTQCDWCGRVLYGADKVTMDVEIARPRATELETRWAKETRPSLHFCAPERLDRNRMGLSEGDDYDERDDRDSCYGKAIGAMRGTPLQKPPANYEWVLQREGGSDGPAPGDTATEKASQLDTALVELIHSRVSAHRSRLALKRHLARRGITTVDQLRGVPDADLIALQYIGPATVKQLRGGKLDDSVEAAREIDAMAFHPAIASLPITELSVPVRVYNALVHAGLVRCGEVQRLLSSGKLGALPGVGALALAQIEAGLVERAQYVTTRLNGNTGGVRA